MHSCFVEPSEPRHHCVIGDETQSSCSAECGGGTQIIERSVRVPPVAGLGHCEILEYRPCNLQSCGAFKSSALSPLLLSWLFHVSCVHAFMFCFAMVLAAAHIGPSAGQVMDMLPGGAKPTMVEVVGLPDGDDVHLFGVVGLPGGTVKSYAFPSASRRIGFSWTLGTPVLSARGASVSFGSAVVSLGTLDTTGYPAIAVGDPGFSNGIGAVFLILMQDCEQETAGCEQGWGNATGAEHINHIVRLSSLDDTIRRAPGGTAIPDGRIGFGAAIAVVPFPGKVYDGPRPDAPQPEDPSLYSIQSAVCIAVAAPDAGDNGEIYLLYLGLRGLVLSVAILEFPNATPAGLAFRPIVLATVKEFPSAFRGWAEPSTTHSLTVQLLIPQWDAAGRVYLLLLRAGVTIHEDAIDLAGLRQSIWSPSLGVQALSYSRNNDPPLRTAVTVDRPRLAVLEAPAQYRGGWGLAVALGTWAWTRQPEAADLLSLTDLDAPFPLLFITADLDGGDGQGGRGNTLMVIEVRAVLRHRRDLKQVTPMHFQKAVDIVGVSELTVTVEGNSPGGVLAGAAHQLEGSTRLFLASDLDGNGWRLGTAEVNSPTIGMIAATTFLICFLHHLFLACACGFYLCITPGAYASLFRMYTMHLSWEAVSTRHCFAANWTKVPGRFFNGLDQRGISTLLATYEREFNTSAGVSCGLSSYIEVINGGMVGFSLLF